MLAALQSTIDLVENRSAGLGELHTIPEEEQGVCDQVCRADSVGVSR
jgi:error-prone DNA polymerase